MLNELAPWLPFALLPSAPEAGRPQPELLELRLPPGESDWGTAFVNETVETVQELASVTVLGAGRRLVNGPAFEFQGPTVSTQTRKVGRPATVTTSQPASAPTLFCLNCDGKLTFIKSIIGGVQPVEHWDEYVCKRCGTTLEFRLRTRTLRRI